MLDTGRDKQAELGNVIVLGSTHVDHTAYVEKFPEPGETVIALRHEESLGGKGANQAAAAAMFGACVDLISALGSDSDSRFARNQLELIGVSNRFLMERPTPTGHAQITVDQNTGENIIVVVSGADNDVEIDTAYMDRYLRDLASPAAGPVSTSIVALTQAEIPEAAITDFARVIHEHDLRLIINLAPFKPLPRHIIAMADPLILNKQEAMQLAAWQRQNGMELEIGSLGRPDTAEDTAVRFLESGLARSVIITLGRDGAAAADANGSWVQKALKVDAVVDTSGAGDASAGILAASLSSGVDLREALYHSTMSASEVVKKRGTITSYQGLREMSRKFGYAPPRSVNLKQIAKTHERGTDPTKLPTRKDVARRAGTSVAVVSYVVNGGPRRVSPTTRDRVKRAIDELNYRPNSVARSLATGESNVYGLVLPNISNPFFSTLAHHLENDLASRGSMMLLLGDSQDSKIKEVELIERFVERQVKGLFVVANDQYPDLSQPTRTGTPVVMIDRVNQQWQVPSVAMDNIAATKAATEHLIQHGHSDIAIISGPESLQVSIDRVAGWRAALDGAGIMHGSMFELYADFTTVGGYAAAESLFERKRPPSAILAASEKQAIGCMTYFRKRGVRVPEDMAVFAVDGTDTATYYTPSLSTVEQPFSTIASEAVNLMEMPTEPIHRSLAATLRIRESCGVHSGSRHRDVVGVANASKCNAV